MRGIDLDIPEGEFTVVVGPSGCGKSTLLRTIAGLEDADARHDRDRRRSVNDVRPRDRNVAMVFQNYALYPYMNVFENIAFGLRARRVKRPRSSAVRGAAEMLGIGALLERYPRELSGGQRQRVAIGRAIVRDARLFLFDEPLSNLDAQLRDEMRTEIKRLHQRLGKTMIYVTHDQIEAMTLADRIVLLQDGVIEQQGAPLDLFERPATRFVAGFLGSPAINFIPADLVSEDGAVSLRLKDGRRLDLPPARSREPRRVDRQTDHPRHPPRAHGARPRRQRAAGLRCARGGDRFGPTDRLASLRHLHAGRPRGGCGARCARREPARRTREPAV